MAITPKITHARDGLKRLLAKEKDHPVLRGWLQSYLNRVQELEDTAWLVINSRTLNGEGEQLDAIGRLLLCPRAELPDTRYRIALRARIRILRSHGLPKDLQDVARLSLGDGYSQTYAEAYPKTSIVTIGGALTAATAAILWANLLATKPGGTRLFLWFSAAAPEDTFTFAPADVVVDDAGRGFSDDAVTDPGGAWADMYGS